MKVTNKSVVFWEKFSQSQVKLVIFFSLDMVMLWIVLCRESARECLLLYSLPPRFGVDKIDMF